MSVSIDDIEYIRVDTVGIEIVNSLGIDSIDTSKLQLEYERLTQELEYKQEERHQYEKEAELFEHICEYYGDDLKEVEGFFSLCKVNDAYESDDIARLFKLLPKKAKKGLFNRL